MYKQMGNVIRKNQMELPESNCSNINTVFDGLVVHQMWLMKESVKLKIGHEISQIEGQREKHRTSKNYGTFTKGV